MTDALKSGIEDDEIREALSRILTSEELRSSQQIQSVLQFIVEQELSGRGEQIKAYTIAVDVLGRSTTFDPQNDSTVRVIAGRLRRALSAYYDVEGREDAIRIDVPKGSYRPSFRRQPVSGTPPIDALPDRTAAHRKTRNWRLGGVLAVGALLLTAVIFLASPSNRQPPSTTPLPRPPVIGVTLFPNLSDDKSLDRLAFGLRFDLISKLATFSWLSVFAEKGVKNVDQRVGNPRYPPDGPAVDYVLSGAIYADDDRVIISYRLSETETQIVRWAKTYRRDMTASSLYGIQGDAAVDISVEIGRPEGVVAKLEAMRSRNSPEDLDAYLCVLGIHDYWRSFSAEEHLELRQCLEQAVDREPAYAEAYAALSSIYLDERRYEFNRREGYDPLERSMAMAEKAVKLDPFSIMAKRALFGAYLAAGNLDAFKRIGRQAIEQSPYDPLLLADFGNKLAAGAGDWEEGISYLHRALGLNPDPAPWYFLTPAFRAILMDDYDRALRWTERMNTPDWFPYHLIRAIGFSKLRDIPATRDALQKLENFAIDDVDDSRERLIELQLASDLRLSLIAGLEGAYQLGELVN